MKKIIPIIISFLVFMSCSNDDDPQPEVCSLMDYSQYSNVEANKLISNLKFEQWILDLWGYNDIKNASEYVLVGFGWDKTLLSDSTGVYIVDVNDASNPFVVSTVNNIGGFDIKTWGSFMYSVNGDEEANGKIVNIENPNYPIIIGEFSGAHNIFISCDGLLILSGFGIQIYDLINDPTKPELLWSDESGSGHEATVVGNILYDFHGFSGTKIYDISEPSNPTLLSIIESNLIRFHHSGWPTEDENLLIINDERPAGSAGLGDDFTIWDITDKKAPKFISKFRDSESSIHNVHIIKNKAYFSYYTAGYRIFDITYPESPEMTFEYDTSPERSGKGWSLGAFGVYALSTSGNVYISDAENGLFIFGK